MAWSTYQYLFGGHQMKNLLSVCCMGLAVAALQACAPGETPESGGSTRKPGRLVIVGGALQADNSAVYDAVVEARAGTGPLCVIPTASGDAPESMNGAIQTLSEYAGEGEVTGVLITTEDPTRAKDPSVAAELAACSGFYFTGGSQSRILDVFLPEGDTTVAYRALWQRWQDGAVVSGSSAGAAMMSRVMISGGTSTEAVSHGVAAGVEEAGVQLRDGMGFFEPLLDQHFLARGRIGRLLISVIRDGVPKIGFGIDENTALVVDGDAARVVGASGVVVVDGRAAVSSGTHGRAGVTVNLVGAGDMLDLRTLEIRRHGAKSRVAIHDKSVQLPQDLFSRWAFLHLVAGLAATEDTEAVFSFPGVTVTIVEGKGFSASMTDAMGGVEGTPYGLSAGPFEVDLVGSGS